MKLTKQQQQNVAHEAYRAIVDPAYEAFLAKLKEINAQSEIK